MQHIFWLRSRLIAGRCGPNLNPWIPAKIAAAGIGAIVSVNDAMSVYPDDLADVGLEHACFPLADNAPPRDGDFEHCMSMLPRSFEHLSTVIDSGKIPLIHCTAGKDRTALTMCYYLCRRESCSPRDAVCEIRRVRPIALSAPGYEDFAIEVLTALQSAKQ